jgi:hypothetical protein
MANLHSAAIEVLTQVVGPVPAELCLCSGSAELGKSSEELTADDYDAIATRIRADLSAFASEELIEFALQQIRVRL